MIIKSKKKKIEILPARSSRYIMSMLIYYEKRGPKCRVLVKNKGNFEAEKRRECMGFSDIHLSNWDLYTFQ